MNFETTGLLRISEIGGVEAANVEAAARFEARIS